MNENACPSNGQERAALRLQTKLAAEAAINRPADKVTRQQQRRAALSLKQAQRRLSRPDLMEAMRAKYGVAFERTRHPGLKTMIGRPFKKPHGQPGWRLRPIAIEDGREVALHTTKGIRERRA